MGIIILLQQYDFEAVFTDLGTTKGLLSQSLIPNKYYVQIDKSLDQKESVVTFFHEVLHLDQRFKRKDPRRNWPKQEHREVERRIDEESYQIYELQPNLVNHIIKNYLNPRRNQFYAHHPPPRP